MSKNNLHKKNVLITGAAGILGTELSNGFAQAGANLFLCDINQDALDSLNTNISKKFSTECKNYILDVAEKKSFDQLKSTLANTKIDVLINNAATKTDNFFEPFANFPLDDWEQVMRVNSTGPMLACQTFGSDMANRGEGSIINILSIYGILAPDQRIYEGSLYEGQAINTPAVYSASKASLLGLTKYLASYWGNKGVRVNAVTPGGIFSGQNETFVNKYNARVPMGRMALADEICSAVLFLASDNASYITGQNIVVDGGLSVW